MILEKNKNHVFSVYELNLEAKKILENGLPLVWVHGEISNFVCAASKHWYFSLKDEQAQVRCVMFRHKNQYVDWLPDNGMQVEILAFATLYDARGEFQLALEQIRPTGLGSLHERFERLKLKLNAEGLFDSARKQPLPFFPKQIGIITSPQAAALRDVLITLTRRMPGIPVVLYPTQVQGNGSEQKIAQTIQLANERDECDVLMLCRGGGSLEDLWAFNEEIVARAIFASRIPLVTGIGHETDFTISDFAADQRAATPTAAAQLVVPEQQELSLRLLRLTQRLIRCIHHQLENRMQQLDYLQNRLTHPAKHVHQKIQHLDYLQQRMRSSAVYILQRQQWHSHSLQQRLRIARPNHAPFVSRQAALAAQLANIMHRILERHTSTLDNLHQHLLHLAPEQVLARGYSIVRDVHGLVVMDSSALQIGTCLDITFAHGRARAELKETNPASFMLEPGKEKKK